MPNRLTMMVTPAVFQGGEIDPFAKMTEADESASFEIFYATDRMPAGERDRERFYLDRRGQILRLGRADLRIGDEDANWDELSEQILLEGKAKRPNVELVDAEEFGLMESSVPYFAPEYGTDEARLPARRFAAEVNEKLQRSERKHIYVYVHGIRVNFENPLLITGELWQYLGRDGVFIAYSWPSTSKSWLAYFADLETAASTVRNLRLFLTFLADETDVEQIHILTYSAGSRVVSNALNEMRLINYQDDEAALREKLKIGKAIFVGPDIDMMVFRDHYRDRIFDLPEQIIIYISQKDNVLRWARRLLREPRLGEEMGLMESDLQFLGLVEDTIAIDVTDAEQATTENGHRYFRNSPWVTSDILMTLKFGFGPAERGLVQEEDDPVWKFPPDYVDHLRQTVAPLYSVE